MTKPTNQAAMPGLEERLIAGMMSGEGAEVLGLPKERARFKVMETMPVLMAALLTRLELKQT